MDYKPLPAGENQRTKRTSAKRWWLLIAGAVVVALGITAIILIPRIIHAQRVAQYTEAFDAARVAAVEGAGFQEEAERLTVLTALQHDEATEFQASLEGLGEYSDHYFTDEHREAFVTAADNLGTVLKTTLSSDALTTEEASWVADGRETLETEGYFWQTDFLNLDSEAMALLVTTPEGLAEILAQQPVPDEDVTDKLVASAQADAAEAQVQREAAQVSLATATERSDALIEAVTAALSPLSDAARTTPDQVEVVLGMYPAANAESIVQMREGSQYAVDAIGAERFVPGEIASLPITGDDPEDVPVYGVTDAWRSVIIADHLAEFSNGVTGAWVSDAGGVEEALGFNPFLPFPFF